MTDTLGETPVRRKLRDSAYVPKLKDGVKNVMRAEQKGTSNARLEEANTVRGLPMGRPHESLNCTVTASVVWLATQTVLNVTGHGVGHGVGHGAGQGGGQGRGQGGGGHGRGQGRGHGRFFGQGFGHGFGRFLHESLFFLHESLFFLHESLFFFLQGSSFFLHGFFFLQLSRRPFDRHDRRDERQ